MTRERLKKLLPVMQAYVEGKQVQYRIPPLGVDWYDVSCPSWEDATEYRIAPEKKFVPFTWEDRELFRDKWIVNKFSGRELKILSIDNITIVINDYDLSYKDLLNNYNFLDGTPCGKVVEG